MKIVFILILAFSFTFYTGCTAVGITIGNFMGPSSYEEVSLSPDSLRCLSTNDKIKIQLENNDSHIGYFSSFVMIDKGRTDYSDTTQIKYSQEQLYESWQIKIKDGHNYFNYSDLSIKKIEINEKNYGALMPVIIGIVIDIYILSWLSSIRLG